MLVVVASHALACFRALVIACALTCAQCAKSLGARSLQAHASGRVRCHMLALRVRLCARAIVGYCLRALSVQTGSRAINRSAKVSIERRNEFKFVRILQVILEVLQEAIAMM